jgi:hypothetical protein
MKMHWVHWQAAFPQFWKDIFSFYTYLVTHEEYLGTENFIIIFEYVRAAILHHNFGTGCISFTASRKIMPVHLLLVYRGLCQHNQKNICIKREKKQSTT